MPSWRPCRHQLVDLNMVILHPDSESVSDFFQTIDSRIVQIYADPHTLGIDPHTLGIVSKLCRELCRGQVKEYVSFR